MPWRVSVRFSQEGSFLLADKEELPNVVTGLTNVRIFRYLIRIQIYLIANISEQCSSIECLFRLLLKDINERGSKDRESLFAAVIKDSLGTPVELKKGRAGQFEIIVDGRTVVSRKGGLIAMLVGRPWPSEDEVVEAVRAAGS